MAESDNSEWRLLDTDLTTQLAIIPTSNSHLYLELNEPGSGELKLPMLSNTAGLITNGTFCQLSYRGTTPGGFFVDSIKEVDADGNEGAGRWMSVSGRGALALLETAIVWDGGTGGSVREFTSVTKASILKTLIDEAQARGGLSVLTYDFTASVDSNAVAWTDSESYEIPVGTTLLDVARQFAATGGFDYEIILSGGTFNLSAYSAGVGTDKSATVKLRIGVNCEEAGRDERGGVDITNAFLIKYKNGYLTVTDPTSISARMRHEKLLSIEQAQSPESAITYASAKLANSKDPLSSKTLRVYDGVAPYLFADYAMGDIITQDRFGAETADRILGIQADFDGVEFSHVVLEMGAILYDTNLKLEKDLDWLMDQWNTAHDANLLETTFWSAIGNLPISTAPDVYHVSDLLVYNGVLYVSLYLDAHSSTGFNCVYQYNISTGVWSSVGSGNYPVSVYRMCQMGGDIYAAGYSDNIGTDPMEIYKWDGSAWTGIGTLNSTGFVNCLATDGTNLYAGADKFGTKIEGVTMSSGVGKWDGASWTSVAAATASGFCYALLWHGGSLYGGFDDGARKLVAGVWSALTGSYAVRDLQTYGSDMVVAIEGAFPYTYVMTWDGSGAMVQIGQFASGGVYDRVERLKVNLTDIYAIGDFTVVGADSGFTNIAKYSGGAWVRVDAGVGIGGSEYGTAVEFSDNSLYVGGLFTVVNDTTPAQNLAVRITDFQDALDFASHSNFDLAGEIHAATASALSDEDEMGFWENVSKALRKITWANIRALFSPSYTLNLIGSATAWATATAYAVGANHFWASNTVVYYLKCKTAHTSGALITDDWEKWEVTATQTTEVSDVAYDATSWNAVTAYAPSKNAVRDQIEIMLTSIAGKIAHSLATAANDFLVASGSGTFVKKTLVETVTILRTSLDSIYAATAKGVTNGDSHDHNGGDGGTIPAGGISAKALLVFGGHGNGGTIPASTTYHLTPYISGLDTVGRSSVVPVAGTIKNLYFRLASTQPASGSLVVEVYGGSVGTTATGVKITVAAGSTSATFSDTTHTFSHAAGDLVTVKITNNATGASGTIGSASFELDTALVN